MMVPTCTWDAAVPSYKIYKISAANNVITASDSIACPFNTGTLQGLTYYNGALWVLQTNTAGMIYKLDPANGAVLDSIVAPGTTGGERVGFCERPLILQRPRRKEYLQL